jgi:hypothetical protein
MGKAASLAKLLVVFTLIWFPCRANEDQKRAKYKWNNDHILELNSQVLPQARSDFPYLVIYVYGSWCISAKGKLSTFEDLAAQHQIIDTKLAFGLLDVKDKSEVEAYGIHEVPAINIFLKEKVHIIDWKDNPDNDAIAAEIEVLFRDEFSPELKQSGFEKARQQESFVLFYGDDKDEHHWDFYKTSENKFSHSVKFYRMSSEVAVQGFSKGKIYFCRPSKECQVYGRGDIDIFNLYDWVNGLSHNLILDLENEAFTKIVSKRQQAIIFFENNQPSPAQNRALEQFELAAETLSHKTIVAKCRIDKPFCLMLIAHMDLHYKLSEAPLVRVVFPIHDAHSDSFAAFEWSHGEINEKSVLKYYRDAIDHKLPIEIRSQEDDSTSQDPSSSKTQSLEEALSTHPEITVLPPFYPRD